ncbi:MAG: hypothetical protein JNM21_01890 [Taibaiella sp.]|nr:hypothetical protein [Taibaiella sp.]
MKYLIFIACLFPFFSCGNAKEEKVEFSASDSLLFNYITQQDHSNNPCRKFNHLKTANDYFQSANSRTKDCPYDSLTNLVALKEYEYALRLDPEFWPARRNYARQLFTFGAYEACIEQVNNIISQNGSEISADLFVLRGNAFYKLEKYKAAVVDYEAAIKNLYNPDYVYMLKAKAEWKLGNIQKACEDFNRAIKSYPAYEKEKEFIDC